MQSGLASDPGSVAGFLARPTSGSLAPRYRWSRPVETDDGWLVGDASDMGWPPGYYPYHLKVGTLVFDLVAASPDAFSYRSGEKRLVVWND